MLDFDFGPRFGGKPGRHICLFIAKAAENVGKGNLSQRAFDAVTELMVALFRAGAERL